MSCSVVNYHRGNKMNNLVQCGDVNFSGGPRTGRASRYGEQGLSAAAATLGPFGEHGRTSDRDRQGKPRLRGRSSRAAPDGNAAANTKASAQIQIQCLY